jgi:regulator of RNase E activity RraA
VTVEPGDFVIADRSAVVFVAAAHIDRVLTEAEMISAREAAIGKALLEGGAPSAVMGGNYEHLLRKVTA